MNQQIKSCYHSRTLAKYLKKRCRKEEEKYIFAYGDTKEEAIQDLKNKLSEIKQNSKTFSYSQNIKFCEVEKIAYLSGITYTTPIFIECASGYFEEIINLGI